MSSDSVLSESECMHSHRMMSDSILSDFNGVYRTYYNCVDSGTYSEGECMHSRNMTFDKVKSDRQ